MSTSKHIDIICIAVTILALLLTALFVNGEALGLTPVADGDAEDGQFTANDLAAGWDTAGAARITLTGDGGGVTGSGAYVYGGDVHILYAGKYVISGELTDGSVIVEADSGDKIWILLDGVSLHCEDSAALIVEQAKKVFLTLADGTENVISSGETYSEDAVSSKIDGAIYSRDDLTINGGGSLRVTAAYKHGVVCNDDLVIAGGSIEITAKEDGIHANDSARFANANITINAGDDGITVSNDDETAYIYIESGNISIPSCYEGIEAIDITIAGGVIDIRPTDDGINANGRGFNSIIRVTGGDITIINENGRDADGLDSNGDIDISGGNIFISVNSGSYALDYGSENGGTCTISGGTVIAAGGSAMAEGFDSSSEQNFIMYTTPAGSAGAALSLKNSSGDVLLSETIPCGFSSVVLSTPELRLGETCTISIDGAEEEVTVDNTSSGGFGMGGMFGGGMRGFGGGMFGGRGGGMERFSNNTQPAAGGAEIPEEQPQEMPGGLDRGTQPTDMPQMPKGDFADGERPQIPNGDFAGGERPRMPDGNFTDGERPQMPDGSFTRGGGMRGDDQRTQWGQDQNRAQGSASETSSVSPDALILVGASILVLLAGILFALKVKH